ncbi:c-type cytochrome [Stutzerimonas stutzeri]|uniref:c-type cytochrome n=1 Tax=Stutzerimonas stutzeri TaxID=316 RepID=UPI0021093AA0|nr:cytochrome c [Stutzerimonas stutzeri]MCQ4322279.1 cytochrome c [Stutzerimonas stutzeri]
MFKILTTLLLAALVLILAAAAVVYFGVVNVAADVPHSGPIRALLETARQRSVAVRAEAIEVPELSDAELIRSGAGNYEAMCVACHLAPGFGPTELSENLSPAPPNLTDANRRRDPAKDFWTIKHGIQATGMPAWGKSMDDGSIWELVAVLEQLPALTAMEYRTLVAASSGHHHGGGGGGGGETHMPSGAPGTAADHHGDMRSAEDHHPAMEPKPEIHRHADGSDHAH